MLVATNHLASASRYYPSLFQLARLEGSTHSSSGSVEHMVFVALVIAGLAFFLFTRRRFDLYSTAYLSAVAYFLPGLFGYVLLPRTSLHESLRAVPILAEVYWIIAAVLAAPVIGAIVFDWSNLGRHRVSWRFRRSSWVGFAALGFSLLGLGVTCATLGDVLFGTEKSELLPLLDRWHHLQVSATLIGTVIAWIQRRKALGAAFALLLLFDLFLGFRYPLAIATIAVFSLWLSRQGRRRLVLEHWRAGVLGLAAAWFFFVVKRLIAPIRAGDWRAAFSKAVDPTLYWQSIAESEPFKIMAILNATVCRNIQIGLDHLSYLKASFLIFSPEMGVKVQTFNEYVVHKQLFPDAVAGVGSNLWAEIWSTGGWSLILTTLALWIACLAGLSVLLRSRDCTLSAVAAILGSYWTFYLHRNDLLFQIILSRRVPAVAAGCVIVAMAAWAIARRSSRSANSPDEPTAHANRD